MTKNEITHTNADLGQIDEAFRVIQSILERETGKRIVTSWLLVVHEDTTTSLQPGPGFIDRADAVFGFAAAAALMLTREHSDR